tara:strand:- start:3247 stop:3957 length:711 start_codon:yes stop_codon:yes gene_type:complete
MRILELFSGTGSVGKVCKKLGYDEIISVDLILPATHTKTDIMTFDYKQYDKDYFDIVWASPPCTAYSNLQNSWIGRKKKDGSIFTKEKIETMRNEADLLVAKTLEIIKYFNPDKWFMENPGTGNLKKRDVVKDLPFYDVDYCMYSDWGYKKHTRIWTNVTYFKPKRCDGKGTCGNMIGGIHKKNIGSKETKKRLQEKNINIDDLDFDKIDLKPTTLHQRYRVPEQLIFDLLGEKLI